MSTQLLRIKLKINTSFFSRKKKKERVFSPCRKFWVHIFVAIRITTLNSFGTMNKIFLSSRSNFLCKENHNIFSWCFFLHQNFLCNSKGIKFVRRSNCMCFNYYCSEILAYFLTQLIFL